MGFSNGMMIEGGARWGYDDIWVANGPDHHSDEEQQKPSSSESGRKMTDNEQQRAASYRDNHQEEEAPAPAHQPLAEEEQS